MAASGKIDVTEALRALRVERIRRETGVALAAPTPVSKKQWPPNYDNVLVWRQQQLSKFDLDPSLAEDAKAYYRDKPVEFIVHWCDTYDPRKGSKNSSVWMPLILFDKQVELVEFLMAMIKGEQEGLIEKSRDMGATWVCAAFSVWLWLFWPAAAIGWGSRGQLQVDRIGDPSTIFEKMRLLIGRLPTVFLPEGLSNEHHLLSMRIINPETGASITGEIGDNIGRGGRTLIYFVDEAAHLAHPEKVEAALLENTSIRIHLSSVSGLGTVFHRKRMSGQEWHRGMEPARDRTNVFVMDWSDHPNKTPQWYAEGKAKAVRTGLTAIFAQEVERNYASAVEGVIIQPEWVEAVVDAHLKIPGMEEGLWGAALDVADGGKDTNALAKRKGVVVKSAIEWGARDVAVSARKAVNECRGLGPIKVQYDSIGVGAGVKSEINNLEDKESLPKGMKFIPWNAAASVKDPNAHVNKKADGSDDKESPKNEDFYYNFKAQAWRELSMRFYKTYKMLVPPKEGDEDFGTVYEYPVDELISIDSTIPLLVKLKQELSQATQSPGSRMKMVVDKAPDGADSPNLADAVVMMFWPAKEKRDMAATDLPMFIKR